MKRKVYFILSMMIFGAVGVFAKYLNIPSSILALFLSLTGTVTLLSIVLLKKQQIKMPTIRNNAAALITAAVTLGGNWIFLFQSYKETTIANAALSYYFAPVIVIILAPLLLKDKFSLIKLTCIAIAMSGLFMILYTNTHEVSEKHLLGISYGLIAATFYAAMTITNKFIHGIDDLTETVIKLGLSSIMLLPFVLLTSDFSSISLTVTNLFWLLLFGILHGGIGFYMFFAGMKGLKANTIAVLSYIDPLTSLIISIVIVREKVTLIQLLGALLLLSAIWLSEIKNRRQKTEST